MPLAKEDYANQEDSLLSQYLKTSAWAKVRSLLETAEGKQMISQPDSFDNLPLHIAIGFKAPQDITISILNEYPQACRVHGTDYRLPLHVAAVWGTSSEVMEAVIRAYPQGLDDTGDPGIKGRTPRHFISKASPANKIMLQRSTQEWIALCEKEEEQQQHEEEM